MASGFRAWAVEYCAFSAGIPDRIRTDFRLRKARPTVGMPCPVNYAEIAPMCNACLWGRGRKTEKLKG